MFNVSLLAICPFLIDDEDNEECFKMMIDFHNATRAERQQSFKVGFTVAMIIADKIDANKDDE